MSARLIAEFAIARRDLPHPLEAPAIEERPFGPVPDYRYELVECRECGTPLTDREYDVDGDLQGDRYVFCGRDTCRMCEDDESTSS